MSVSDLQRFYLPLLQEHARLRPGARVLDLGYFDPTAALWAADEVGGTGSVVALRPALDLASELEKMGSAAGKVAEVGTLTVRLGDVIAEGERGTFDAAIVLAPFFLGNAPVRRAVRTAATALKPDGTMFLQAHRRHGGATYVRFAEEAFSDVEMAGMGGGQRRLYVARGSRLPEPGAPSDEVPVNDSSANVVELMARGVTLRFKLTAGVFAAKGIDAGTKLLVHTAVVPAGAHLLDIGCGAGVIGLTFAGADKRCRVTLVDVTKAAVDLTRENVALNELRNAEVRLSDGYEAVTGDRFDAILSNLPAHRGVEHDTAAAERFIAQAPGYLRTGGELWLVANKALGYELPASRVFREVRVAANDGRYKVLQCRGVRASGRQ